MSTFVFFGASGDLFAKKLSPAFGRLLKDGSLPGDTKLIGVSRKSWTDDDFREKVRTSTPHIPPQLVSFIAGDVKDEGLSERLSAALSGDRVLFYVALSSLLYVDALRVAAEVRAQTGMKVTVLVEKPFGRSASEAAALDEAIDTTVGEESVLRVDHYIQKESVQNVLAYRFSNELFNGVWAGKAMSRIHVFLNEADLIGNRGEFYDTTGVLNDVVQNHLLVLLSAATKENPGIFTAEKTREARRKILSLLRIAPHGHTRAQYEGYRDTPGVAPGSNTETYVRLNAYIDHPDWEDVPIILEAGKGLSSREIGVRMHLRQSGSRICFDEECSHENVFEFLLAPEEKTSLTVWGKKPGLTNTLMPHTLSFSFADAIEGAYVDPAYDRVLFDAWSGDLSRFVSREETRAAWAFVDEARRALEATPLRSYPKGAVPSVIL
jgi:glucose-6-phosphate 1-dehydrogenase